MGKKTAEDFVVNLNAYYVIEKTAKGEAFLFLLSAVFCSIVYRKFCRISDAIYGEVMWDAK